MKYIVVVEHDGKKPSSRFYSRLHRLGLKVQASDKSLGVWERRETESPALVLQEGAIVVRSLSTARYIAQLAEDEGAVVQVGKVADLDTFNATQEDVRAYARIEQTLGRRGRPPANTQKSEWLVTCFECAYTSHVLEDSKPVACPQCAGINVDITIAKLAKNGNADRGDLYDIVTNARVSWLKSRIRDGHVRFIVMKDGVSQFDNKLWYPETVSTSANQIMAEIAPALDDIWTRATPSNYAWSTDLLVHLADCVLASRWNPQAAVEAARMQALTKYLASGGTGRYELLDDMDIFSAAFCFGVDELVDLLLK